MSQDFRSLEDFGSLTSVKNVCATCGANALFLRLKPETQAGEAQPVGVISRQNQMMIA